MISIIMHPIRTPLYSPAYRLVLILAVSAKLVHVV